MSSVRSTLDKRAGFCQTEMELGIGFPAKHQCWRLNKAPKLRTRKKKKPGNPGKTGKHWAGRTNLRRKFSKVRGTPWPPLVKVRECRSQLQDAHAIGSALLCLGGRDAAAHRELSKNSQRGRVSAPAGWFRACLRPLVSECLTGTDRGRVSGERRGGEGGAYSRWASLVGLAG